MEINRKTVVYSFIIVLLLTAFITLTSATETAYLWKSNRAVNAQIDEISFSNPVVPIRVGPVITNIPVSKVSNFAKINKYPLGIKHPYPPGSEIDNWLKDTGIDKTQIKNFYLDNLISKVPEERLTALYWEEGLLTIRPATTEEELREFKETYTKKIADLDNEIAGLNNEIADLRKAHNERTKLFVIAYGMIIVGYFIAIWAHFHSRSHSHE